MTSVKAPSGESVHCPTTSRRPALVPRPAMKPVKRSIRLPYGSGRPRRTPVRRIDAAAVERTTLAKLHFRYGAMNAGKSTGLLQASFNYEDRGPFPSEPVNP